LQFVKLYRDQYGPKARERRKMNGIANGKPAANGHSNGHAMPSLRELNG